MFCLFLPEIKDKFFEIQINKPVANKIFKLIKNSTTIEDYKLQNAKPIAYNEDNL